MYLPTIYLFLYTDIPTRYLFLYSAVKPLFIEMLCLIYFIASHHENLTLLSSSIVSIWRGAINEGITAGATAAGSKPVATTPSSRRVLDRWIRRHLDGSLIVGYAPIGYAYLAGEETFTWGTTQRRIASPRGTRPLRFPDLLLFKPCALYYDYHLNKLTTYLDNLAYYFQIWMYATPLSRKVRVTLRSLLTSIMEDL